MGKQDAKELLTKKLAEHAANPIGALGWVQSVLTSTKNFLAESHVKILDSISPSILGVRPTMPARLLVAICLLAVMPSLAFTADPAQAVEPTGMWAGKIKDESLRKLAPKPGFIADAETWKKLWKAWRPDEDLPKVDFAKELILVGTVPGPNLVVMRPTIDDGGNVNFIVGGTKIGGPGFGYKLIKISKDDVKTVNGKVINAVAEDSITVTVVGTLRTGIFAIGGETTGTTITANGVTWELDFGKNAELRKTAEKLNGKKVVVQGSLERRRGVEIRERWIVTVTGLRG